MSLQCNGLEVQMVYWKVANVPEHLRTQKKDKILKKLHFHVFRTRLN